MSILSLHKKEAVVERRSTGIPGLDELVKGGFPNHCGIILLGPPGCGKSLFCEQFVWEGLKKGEFGLYVAIDHSPNEIRQSMSTFGWDITPYEDKGMFVTIDGFNGTLGIGSDEKYRIKNPSDINEQMYVIDKCVKNVANTFGNEIKVRAVYDSASVANLRNLSTFFKIGKWLLSYTKTFNVVGICTVHKGAQGSIIENAILQVVDGIIELDKRIENNTLNYFIWIDKMMMTAHDQEVHQYFIKDEGVYVDKLKAQGQ
jgi:KaiC/GvpD/RAD55 family RecA-like ATPase